MSDEVVSGAPGGGATPAGGSGGGTSVAAPPTSAPVSQPAVAQPATPAVATPVTSTPETAPVKQPGEADDKFLTRFHEWNDKQPKPTGDEKPVVAEPAKPAVAAEPEKPVEPAKPAEAVKPATEAEKPAVAAAVDPLDTLGPLPAAKMAELLTANPELDAALEKAGIKDELFQGLREAAIAQQYRQEFPDIETAKFAKGAAITMHQMDLAATELKPGDLKSTSDFVQKVLMPLSYVLDDNGQPKMREVTRSDGSKYQVPETDGTVQTMLSNFRDVAIEQLVADADMLSKRDNPQHKELGERLLSAVHEIKSFIKGGEDTEDLPENLKIERERNKADRAAIDKRLSDEADQRYTSFKTDVMEASNAALDKDIGSWLDQSSLAIAPTDSQQVKDGKEFSRNAITREIRDALFAQFGRDELFLAEQEQKGRRGYTAATKVALVNHYTRSAAHIMETIAGPILTKAGHERVRQSAAKAQKIAAQEKISKMEPRGATSPANTRPAQVDKKAIMEEARQELMQKLRRDPQPGEMIELFRTKLAQAAKQIPA